MRTRGWQTIISADKKLLTYMGIFTPDGDDSWSEAAGYFPAIDGIVCKHGLQDVADVSLNARVLTVAFHLTEQQVVPDVVKEAAEELTVRLTTEV